MHIIKQAFEYKFVLQPHFYSVLSKENAQKEVQWLNELGAEGWDLFEYRSLNGPDDLYKFKRRIEIIQDFDNIPLPDTKVPDIEDPENKRSVHWKQ